MNSNRSCALLIAALAFGLGGTPVARAASQPAPASPAAPPPPPPKSLFTFDPKTSKDPFFPKTDRFKRFAVKTNDTELPPPPLFPEGIRYKGFSGTPGRPMAIINNKTVEKGERFELLINGQRIRIQCVEIKDRSVVLEINGITKELKLRADLQ